ncbi:MAG: hypothetical protein IPP79_18750 [Chitinophagaceae bacterium]|nr:hypothetical protein [Chitinophagaceae bacterium]
MATVNAPDVAFIANAPFVLPDRIEKARACPASGSLATTVPTAVPMARFSAIVKVWFAITGTSFTLVRLMVIFA